MLPGALLGVRRPRLPGALRGLRRPRRLGAVVRAPAAAGGRPTLDCASFHVRSCPPWASLQEGEGLAEASLAGGGLLGRGIALRLRLRLRLQLRLLLRLPLPLNRATAAAAASAGYLFVDRCAGGGAIATAAAAVVLLRWPGCVQALLLLAA